MNLTLRLPPLAVTATAGILAWIGARNFPTLNVEWSARIWLTAALGIVGATCSLLGVASFRRARTTVNPLHPATSTSLVVSGIYRLTRNPMYLGFLLLLLSEIAWLGNPVALLIVPAFVIYLNRFQISPEETALQTRFGPTYSSYLAQVRRWL